MKSRIVIPFLLIFCLIFSMWNDLALVLAAQGKPSPSPSLTPGKGKGRPGNREEKTPRPRSTPAPMPTYKPVVPSTPVNTPARGSTTQAPVPGRSPGWFDSDKKIDEALKTGKVLLNFDSVDIRVITRIMAELTGLTIILDNKVTGSITIISSRKVTIKEAWELYKAALEAAGFGIVNYGKYVKVMQLADAQKEDTRYVGAKVPRIKKGHLVAVVLMAHSDAELMANTLRPMMTPGGVISAYRLANAVVITDTAKNVTRLTEIVRQLDSNYRGNSLRIYQPKYVQVAELAKSLQPLFTAAGNTPEQQIKVSAYEPTNSLLIVAPEVNFLQIESILSEIDNEDRVIKPDAKRFRVHYLHYANAEDVAKIMTTMMEEKKKIVEEVKKEQEGTQEAKTKEEFIATKVSADVATNSLILYVTDKEFEALKKMIAKLDAPRKQVLVSAVIAEISFSKLMELGARWHIATDKGLAAFQGGLSLDQIYNALSGGQFVIGGMSEQGVELDVAGTTLKYPNVFFILKALETDNAFNLLSAPRLLTEDHKESSINVGQVIPFATGVKFDATGQPVITYDYKDVGLTLTVTPHISQGDHVRMEIDQVIKDVTEYLKPTTGSISYVVPILSNREVKTTITLGNNQTIIIGGLVSHSTLKALKKVPFLNKLPLIGEFFKDDSTKTQRTTLFVFLTPHIIDSPKSLEEITEKYGRTLHEEKADNEKSPVIIDENKENH